MTLIVAIKYKDGVVMGTDKRIVSGGAAPLKRDEERKIEQISKNAAIACAGLIGMINKLIHDLKANYRTNENASIVDIVFNIEDELWTFYRRYKERFDNDTSSFPTAIVGEKDKIFRVFPNGYSEEFDTYVCEGSGKPYGDSILGEYYRKNMELEEALDLAIFTILQTSKFDPYVSESMSIAWIDADGFHELSEAEIEKRKTKIVRSPRRSADVENIVNEIVELRRWINIEFEKKFQCKLFKEREYEIHKLRLQCLTEEDFTNLIANLGVLVESINVKDLKEKAKLEVEGGSINVLEEFLKKTSSNFDDLIIKNLRDIITLRSKKSPIHSDDSKVIDVILRWGEIIPPDWESLGIKVLQKYLEHLQKVREWINKLRGEK